MEIADDIRQKTTNSSDFEEVRLKMDRLELTKTLDAKLECYLKTLDEYDKIMKEISKLFSSGFMSLAEANFHNRSSAIRYGQDCYDERMQATRKVYINEEGLDTRQNRPFVTIRTERKEVERSDGPKQSAASGKDATQTASVDASPETNEESTDDAQDANTTTASSPKSIDPLRWFGILVPPALRTAQSTFIQVLEGPIARLVVITKDLKALEVEIGRVRKQIKKL